MTGSYELKFDGYRALLIKDGPQVELRSRNDKNLARMYRRLIAAAEKLEVERVASTARSLRLIPPADPPSRPSNIA
jgi:ATP-dependent DNA ligase